MSISTFNKKKKIGDIALDWIGTPFLCTIKLEKKNDWFYPQFIYWTLRNLYAHTSTGEARGGMVGGSGSRGQYVIKMQIWLNG